MTTKKLTESSVIWVIGSIAFFAVIWGAFLIIETFGPKGDAGFGFSLGLVPSLVALGIGYLIVSCWAMISSYAKPITLSEKLPFFVRRFMVVGAILGALVVLNALVVYRLYLVH